MIHYASPAFWSTYSALPISVQKSAQRNYKMLIANPKHPSLHFKKVNRYWSARASLHYRALAVEVDHDLLWFWIGSHADYDQLIKS